MFEVIGLLGEAGSGKDLVADWLVREKNYLRVSYADLMKRFMYELYGFPYVALWGESAERTKLYDIHQGLRMDYVFSVISSLTHTLGMDDKSMKKDFTHDVLNHFIAIQHKGKACVREVIQVLGTDIGRKYDPLMWVNYVHEKIVPSLRKAFTYSNLIGLVSIPSMFPDLSEVFPDLPRSSGVIITDHRYANEVEATKARGGKVYRLRRLALDNTNLLGSTHTSETEQKTLPDELFDGVLEFEEGTDKVYAVLAQTFK